MALTVDSSRGTLPKCTHGCEVRIGYSILLLMNTVLHLGPLGEAPHAGAFIALDDDGIRECEAWMAWLHTLMTGLNEA